MNHWIYDKETLSNCYVGVFEDYATPERHVFVIHDLRNDLPQLVEFINNAIKTNQRFIGFNNLAFDSQILQFIINNHKKWTALSGCEVAKLIYNQAQKTIEKSDKGEFAEFPEWKQTSKQVDLYKMNHWDNPAKASSLKWIQFSMDWYNVQEMPIHHTTVITTLEQIDQIIVYCINDVGSTKEIYVRSKEQLKLRQALTKEYGINLYSASEPRISKELFGYFLSKRLGIEKSELKQMRTPREKIVVKDILLPYLKFTTPEFQKIYDAFKEDTVLVNGSKLSFKSVAANVQKNQGKGMIANGNNSSHYSTVHKGVRSDYGLGGIHGCRSKGIYEAKDGMIIMTSDVTSFYPNLAIRNKWSPGHLSKEAFCELYEWFFEERKKIPKKDPKNYVFKIILNSTYGLSNDPNSFLYDPEFTMKITINGQLSLTMLYEMLSTRIPDSVPIMQNTDGLELMIPEQYYDLYMQICKEWEELTSLQLEHDQYKKIVLFDVNNYIAVYKNGKTKCKGRFDFEDLALHKNKSFLIIPKTIYNYFVNDIKPEKFMANNQNIFDYCGGVKAKGTWFFQEHSLVNGEYRVVDLQKMIRYYISKSGVKVVKKNRDGREIQIESGRWLQTTMNLYEEKPFEQYDVNLDYYLESIYKEINSVDDKVSRNYTQLTMF